MCASCSELPSNKRTMMTNDESGEVNKFLFRAPRDELRELVQAGGGQVAKQPRVAQVNDLLCWVDF